MSDMLVQRPYLLRAFYDWIVDSECTPHIIVDATQPNVEVPVQFIENGKIILNIAPCSVVGFSLDDDAISFNARFSGVATQVYVPFYAIEGIYANENGAGTVFPEEKAYKALEQAYRSSIKAVKEDKPKRPTLTIVK